jgi:glycine oxidase
LRSPTPENSSLRAACKTNGLIFLLFSGQPMSLAQSNCPTDTLIVGGGIIGLSLAYELAARGQVVALVERDTCGRAASWAGVGILPPVAIRGLEEDPLEQLRSLSHRLLAEWAGRLQAETAIDTGWRACGGIYLATTPAEAATLAANKLWWDDIGVVAQAWSSADLIAHEPALTPLAGSGSLRAIWWLPGECQVRTPHYVRALQVACRQRGVNIVEHCSVTGIEQVGGRATAALTTQGRLTAKNICITAGPWTRQLLEPLGVTTGILPIRGQIVLFRLRERLLKSIVNEGHRYLVSRDDGHVLVGSNEEEVGFQCETSPEVIADLCAWAYGIVPELRQAEMERTWAGLRPGSFDSYPYIGQLAECPNLYVAAGHYRAGIHLSCGTAHVMAELITSGRASIDLFPFRPSRG